MNSRILVVDDEPNMRRILVSNLRQERYEVVEAARCCAGAPRAGRGRSSTP